ncbi:MAG: dihydroorotase [Bacteroidales bacterium]
MATHPILLTNALIVNEGKTFKGHLLLSDGKIEHIFEATRQLPALQNTRRIDLEGMMLLPGVIDDHVHFREPGLTHKGDLLSESRAAVAGGVTSFMEMPNTVPQTTTQQALEDKFLLAGQKSLANYSFYIGATNDNHDELQATDARHVCGIKLFMGSSTGNMLVDSNEALSRLFRTARLPVAVHTEDEDTIRRNLQQAIDRYGDDIPFEEHARIRSHEACFLSTSRAIALARKYDARLHILHLSTAQETSLLESNVALGQKQITAEACVHHLWFTDEDYRTKGSLVKWNPAIKTGADRQALRQGLIDGSIDVVGTDHAPHTLAEKQNNYLKAPSGGPSIQHSLVTMLELVHQGVYTLEQVVMFMCHHPAGLFGVTNRGYIRKGYAADLVAVSLNKPFTVEKEQLHYKCGWSPMEGATLNSQVEYTIVNGHVVYEKGTFHPEIKGMALEFSR